jgi:hypothetical protein
MLIATKRVYMVTFILFMLKASVIMTLVIMIFGFVYMTGAFIVMVVITVYQKLKPKHGD